MTLARYRELITLVPFRHDRFGVQKRLLSYVDRELLELRGPEADAPALLWDDHGMVIVAADDAVEIRWGGRIEGMWAYVPKPQPKPEPSREGDGEVGAGTGVPEVVAG